MDDVNHIPQMEYEEEINLLDLFLVLLKHKWLIFVMVALSSIGAVIISLRMPNIYRSEATIVPRETEKSPANALSGLGGFGGIVAGQLGLGGGGTQEKLEVALKSRVLTKKIIEKYKLMPVIFSDSWNAHEKRWKTDEPPTIQDGINAVINGLLKVKADKKNNTIKVAFDLKDPKQAKRVVGYYISELSEALREEVLRDAGENMRFFRRQLIKATDPLLKEKIYTMLAKEIEKDTFARAQKYYGFQVIDPPIAPDLNKKVKPKRRLICILSFVVSLFMAIFLAFFLEYINRVKTEDPERYREVSQAMKLRKK